MKNSVPSVSLRQSIDCVETCRKLLGNHDRSRKITKICDKTVLLTSPIEYSTLVVVGDIQWRRLTYFNAVTSHLLILLLWLYSDK